MGTQIVLPPTPGVASAANAYQALFDAAYYAAKPLAFQPLYKGRACGAQLFAADPLTQDQVNTLIAQLLAQLATPSMNRSTSSAWTRTPSCGIAASSTENTFRVPRASAMFPELRSRPLTIYAGPVPAGAIKVSTLVSDYPALPGSVPAVPVAPPTPQAANPVGISNHRPGTVVAKFRRRYFPLAP